MATTFCATASRVSGSAPRSGRYAAALLLRADAIARNRSRRLALVAQSSQGPSRGVGRLRGGATDLGRSRCRTGRDGSTAPRSLLRARRSPPHATGGRGRGVVVLHRRAPLFGRSGTACGVRSDRVAPTPTRRYWQRGRPARTRSNSSPFCRHSPTRAGVRRRRPLGHTPPGGWLPGRSQQLWPCSSFVAAGRDRRDSPALAGGIPVTKRSGSSSPPSPGLPDSRPLLLAQRNSHRR